MAGLEVVGGPERNILSFVDSSTSDATRPINSIQFNGTVQPVRHAGSPTRSSSSATQASLPNPGLIGQLLSYFGLFSRQSNQL